MARIFFALAVFAVLLLAANLVLGLTMGPYAQRLRALVEAHQKLSAARGRAGGNGTEVQRWQMELERRAAAFRPVYDRKILHVWVGIAAALTTLLVNSVSITYFIGTSRWCREVVEAYGLDRSLAERSLRLKRRTFPWSLAAILTVLAIAFLGAAADPEANLQRAAVWAPVHFLAAVVGTVFIAWSFLVQVARIGANYEVIAQILQQVREIRTERGLDQTEVQSLA